MDIQADTDLLTLIQHTGTVARAVLIILTVFSIWSWGIIVAKTVWFTRMSGRSKQFWKAFRKGHSLTEVSAACKGLRFSPLVPVFASAVEVIHSSPESIPFSADVVVTTSRLGTLQRSMQRAAAAQVTKLEKHLTFLATTAAVAPFVGLFGTVWGVMTAFLGLANTETATIQAVAPGIAEALIATAFGLFAAIPAVMAYNQFLYRIRIVGGDLDDLQSEMMAIAESRGI